MAQPLKVISLADQIRQAMKQGGNFNVEMAEAIKGIVSGKLTVYLHKNDNGALINKEEKDGEKCDILWLPWKQGNLPCLGTYPIESVPENTLFFTYYLSGCKIFGIKGGPIWHIDAPILVSESIKVIKEDEWVEDNWEISKSQQVAYLHRLGQQSKDWDLSDYLKGDAPTTYGKDNVGQCIVGGIVNAEKQIHLYYYDGKVWKPFDYTTQTLLK